MACCSCIYAAGETEVDVLQLPFVAELQHRAQQWEAAGAKRIMLDAIDKREVGELSILQLFGST